MNPPSNLPNAGSKRPDCRPWALACAVATIFPIGIALAPGAVADSTETLRSAIVQARAGTSCGPLKSNPIVDQAAAKINQSTQDYLNHTANQIPITDPVPGLKILGYPGGHATAIQGAAQSGAISIKALLLQGFDKIPNCSYRDFGVNMQRNEASGYELTVAVLAGA